MIKEWQDLSSVIIGNYGEEIVKNDFKKDPDYIVYETIDESPHPLDIIIFDKLNKNFMWVDVKTYPWLDKLGKTGIEKRHWDMYRHILHETKYKWDFLIFFVDEIEEVIYYTRLNDYIEIKKGVDKKPIKEIDSRTGKKICFNMEDMILWRMLKPEEILKLNAIRINENLILDKTKYTKYYFKNNLIIYNE